ncbi:PDZ domain-containing protein [bacterium]|nr:PDZ domain-containing protein [candidate division CSSED10-310 bacterium]
MRKHKVPILIPAVTIILCWTLLTDATEKTPGTLEYLELFSQCFELVQSRYLESTDPVILAEGAIEGMMLETSHYAALQPRSGSSGLIPPWGPVELGVIIGFHEPMIRVIDVLPGSIAESKGIQPGDTIIRINDQVTPFLPVDRAARMLTGQPGDSLEILTQSHLTLDINELTIEFQPVEAMEPVQGWSITEVDPVRIIRFAGDPGPDTAASLYDALTVQPDMPTILDLRHMNRGPVHVGIQLADLFIGDGVDILATCDTGNKILSTIPAGDGRALTNCPLAVIIDQTSSGPAETCAAALQAVNRATIIGDRSFGMAVQRETRMLSDEYNVVLVTGWFCMPDGRPIHPQGITPDMPVQLPIADDGDAYLDTALLQVSRSSIRT